VAEGDRAAGADDPSHEWRPIADRHREAGEAMAVLPRVLADRRSVLMRLDPPLPEPSNTVKLGVHPDMRDTPRIRALIDFLVAELKARSRESTPAAVVQHCDRDRRAGRPIVASAGARHGTYTQSYDGHAKQRNGKPAFPLPVSSPLPRRPSGCRRKRVGLVAECHRQRTRWRGFQGATTPGSHRGEAKDLNRLPRSQEPDTLHLSRRDL
jgi:hypothetical protein